MINIEPIVTYVYFACIAITAWSRACIIPLFVHDHDNLTQHDVKIEMPSVIIASISNPQIKKRNSCACTPVWAMFMRFHESLLLLRLLVLE